MPADRERSMTDELRQKLGDLKEQLEQEKYKVKQFQHEKVAEIKHIREQEQAKWEKEKISLKKKYLKEKNDAVNKILDNLKKKDKGIGDLLNQKDEEIKMLQLELHEKDNDAMSTSSYATDAMDRDRDKLAELRDQFETEKARLMQSMFELRTEKMRLEDEVDILKEADREKAVQLRQQHDKHLREIQNMKRASALESRKQMEELRTVERRVMDKEKEIARKSKRLSQIEMSKEELQEKLNEQKLSERMNMSMSMIDLNSSFSPGGMSHHQPIIRARGKELARSSSTFSYGKLSRSSSTSNHLNRRSMVSLPSSPAMASRSPSASSEKKLADDREKGLQQRNAELSARIKQMEERILALQNENDHLRTKQVNGASDNGIQSVRKRRLSLSTICANLEEKNEELTQQNATLESRIKDLESKSMISAKDTSLQEQLKIQEKEKLVIERTLAQLLAQSNINLPKDVRENIENQALQAELDDAFDSKTDNKQIESLKSEVEDLENKIKQLKDAKETEESQLKHKISQLRDELGALKSYKDQLIEQYNVKNEAVTVLTAENGRLKQRLKEAGGGGERNDPERVAQQTRDLKNEVEMLREEKQRLLDNEAAAQQKIKLLEEVQMQLVKKEEKNSRYYDDVAQKLSLITKEKNDLTKRVQEYEQQRRYEAEEMASMLNDRNEYLQQLEKDKEYLKRECETYRLSNMALEDRLQKMESYISPDKGSLLGRISELEEQVEVVEALRTTNEELKNHIRQHESEKGAVKKQHNEELQRVIRTLDKKNKEHNQKSEELRTHIKRLEADLRNLEQSKMENNGNLQIKSQELSAMSQYVKKLEDTEKDLRAKLESYQRSTVNGVGGYWS